MSPAIGLIGLLAFSGLTLALSELRWFRRVALADRLRPYAAGMSRPSRSGVLSVASFRDVIAPMAQLVGSRLARLFGVSEELSTRLRRIHSPFDVARFRIRQTGWAGATLLGAALTATVIGAAPAIAALLVLGAPMLTFLLLEQQIANASEAWQRRIFLELPVVAEQLGMLMTAGWSLSAALDRIATRGSGACAVDLRRVTGRMDQGLTEVEALREWGQLAEVEALTRLLSVLALNRETADLGRLISAEARGIRRDAHRELVESIERRNQQVWVPVTVAALIPGVLLMAVPFVDALSLFTAS